MPKHRVSLECPFKKVWKIFCQNWSPYLAASCTALVTSAHGKPHSELSELRFAASLDITCSRNPKLQKSSNHGMFIQTSRLFTVKCNAIGKLQTSSLLFLFFSSSFFYHSCYGPQASMMIACIYIYISQKKGLWIICKMTEAKVSGLLLAAPQVKQGRSRFFSSSFCLSGSTQHENQL